MKEQGAKRRISRSGRAKMAAAGRVNLAMWKARAPTRANAIAVEVDAFRSGLLQDAGLNPTTTRTGLIEAATTTYASIIIVRTKLVHSRRADVLALTERVSWLTSNMLRILRSLGLDHKARPRSLGEVLARKGAATTSKAVETGGKPS